MKAFSNKSLYLIILLAVVFFVPLFTFRGIGSFDFWWWMSSNLLVMMTLSFILDPGYLRFLKADFNSAFGRKVILGVASAGLLYLVFLVGNYLSRMWFGFAGEGIEKVYGFKGDATSWRIGILMLLVIGPGEELFWRGMLQRHLERLLGPRGGFMLAAFIYTFVHVFTGNLMLIVAALVAGLFWGWMYMRYKSLLMNIVSHTVWDIAVFLVLPFTA